MTDPSIIYIPDSDEEEEEIRGTNAAVAAPTAARQRRRQIDSSHRTNRGDHSSSSTVDNLPSNVAPTALSSTTIDLATDLSSLPLVTPPTVPPNAAAIDLTTPAAMAQAMAQARSLLPLRRRGRRGRAFQVFSGDISLQETDISTLMASAAQPSVPTTTTTPSTTIPSTRPSRKRKGTPPEPYYKPMERGKALVTPTGFDALNMHYPHCKAPERSTVVYHLAAGNFTKTRAHAWRQQWDQKAGPSATLWEMAQALAAELAAKKVTLPATSGFPKYKDNHDNDKPQTDETSSSCCPPSATIPIGPLRGHVLDTLYLYFRALVHRTHHQARVAAIQPETSAADSLECGICADAFAPQHVIACHGNAAVHFFCQACFVQYATVTVQSGPIQTIACPVPDCPAVFGTADVQANLSEFDVLMINDRQASRDRRVALAAKAVLHCVCGTVGILTDNVGVVACPGCHRRYCYQCGNDAHGDAPCPPPAETVQWLDKNSKECPNCKNRIEKNGGCK